MQNPLQVLNSKLFGEMSIGFNVTPESKSKLNETYLKKAELQEKRSILTHRVQRTNPKILEIFNRLVQIFPDCTRFPTRPINDIAVIELVATWRHARRRDFTAVIRNPLQGPRVWLLGESEAIFKGGELILMECPLRITVQPGLFNQENG